MALHHSFFLGEYEVTLIVTGGEWKENCYLVHHPASHQQVLIDPGDDPDLIADVIVKNEAALEYILLTHAHHDHVGAVAALCRRFGTMCHIHRADVRLLRHAPTYALRFANKLIAPVDSFSAFDDTPQITLGENPIKVIHAPGHTPGSVCYDFGRFLFTGDTLMYQRLGRSDLPGSNIALLKKSVSHLLESLTYDTVLFPGHGREWTRAGAQAWWREVSEAPPQLNQHIV
jgi:hydroxyacylglutathione hydrolase